MSATETIQIATDVRSAHSLHPVVSRRRKPIAREAIMRRAAKASATKLAKRITKSCKHCGKEWKEKPSHAWRQYCSRACMKVGQTKARDFPCPRCGVMVFRKQSEAHRLCPDCVKQNLSERNKRTGLNPYSVENEASKAKRLAWMASEENRKRVSAIFKDKHPQSPLLKKYSPNHVKAVECFFRDPRNVVHYCRNICRFVHENQHLFNPEDVIQKIHGGKPSKSYVCNATQGLSQVSRGHRMTWKGWAVVSNREGRERFDLIGRNWQEAEPANGRDERPGGDKPTA